METLKDIWRFIVARKKFYLVPLIIILLIFGVLFIIGGSSALAPYIYTLF